MKKIILIILSLLGLIGVSMVLFVAYFITNVDYKWTGQELFEATNKYRMEHNLSTIELDPILCDNLIERWYAIKLPDNGHKGFEQWARDEGIYGNEKYGQIAEMFVKDVSTIENAIALWTDSPGHRLTLEMPGVKYGCTYASEGTGVFIMATEAVKK